MLEITTETSNHLIMLVETATWKRSRKVNLTVSQRRRNQICLQWLEWVTNFLFVFFCYAGNQSKKLFNSIIPESLQLLIYWPKGLKSLGTRLAECKMNQTMSLIITTSLTKRRSAPGRVKGTGSGYCRLCVAIISFTRFMSSSMSLTSLVNWSNCCEKRPCHDTWYKKVKKKFQKKILDIFLNLLIINTVYTENNTWAHRDMEFFFSTWYEISTWLVKRNFISPSNHALVWI